MTHKFVTTTAPASSDSAGAATATCDAGQHVIGGGARLDDPAFGVVDDSYPGVAGTAWAAHVANAPKAACGFTVYAICTTATTVS